MSNVNEQMQIEFHERAAAVFFTVYHAFEAATSGLDRTGEEYKFQQVKKQFALTLQAELGKIARDVLTKHQGEKRVSETDQTLHQFIKDYLHRFVQKINDV